MDLEAIKARHALTGPGPWFPVVDDCIGGWMVANVDAPASQHDNRYQRVGIANFVQKPDAEFIAYAHSDIPALIAEVERLRSQVDRGAELPG